MIKRYTTFALILSLILLAAFFWWFNGDLLATGIYLGIAALAVLTVPLLYRFAGYSEADDEVWLEERESKDHSDLQNRLKTIRGDLQALSLDEGVRQADLLSDLIDDYHGVVEARFAGRKHAPISYLSAARTVQKHAVQNLADAVAVGHSMSTLSRNQRQPEQIGSSDQQQRDAQRGEMFSDQHQRLEGFFEENNKLFHSLSETAVEVANMRSLSDFERTDTLARLVALAQVAKQGG